MIYCPHCRRPSARNSGACPHCGKDLAGGTAPRPEPGATTGAAGARVGGVEFDLDDDGSTGDLELAGDDYMAPQDAAVQGIPGLGRGGDLGPPQTDEPALQLADVDASAAEAPSRARVRAREVGDDEVRAAAGFGSPRPGPVGAIRYWLLVSSRLKALAEELDRAAESQRSAADRLRGARAALGRKAREASLTGDELEGMVTRALRADGELSGAENRRAGIESEQRDKLRELEQAIARLDAEAAPIRAEEAEAGKRLEALRTDRKRIEAKVKRAEIERRNLNEMIEKRQQAYADLKRPQPERQQLLADITRFERELAPIDERIVQARGEITAFDKPIADAEAALTAVRGRVSEKLTRISALRDELDRINHSFGAAVGSAAVTVQEEQLRAAEAWAAVGERVFAGITAGKGGPLPEEREAVAAALERAEESGRRVEILTRARDSYDRGAVKQAKRFALIGGIALVVLIGLALYLIAS